MANTLSDVMQKIVSKPRDMTASGLDDSPTLRSTFTVTVNDTNGNGDILPMGRFQASDRIHNIWLANGVVALGTDFDLGFYEKSDDWTNSPGAAVDADILFDGVDMSTGRLAFETAGSLCIGTGAGSNSIGTTSAGWTIYEMVNGAGSTIPEPGTEWDLCLTANVMGTPAAGGRDIKLIVEWTRGE